MVAAKMLALQVIRLYLYKRMGLEMTFACLFHQHKTQACVHDAAIEIQEAFLVDSLSFWCSVCGDVFRYARRVLGFEAWT